MATDKSFASFLLGFMIQGTSTLLPVDNATISATNRRLALMQVLLITLSALALLSAYATTTRPHPAALAELDPARIHRVFVTGFEPFLKFSANPSGEVALALNGNCAHHGDANVCFTGVRVPVTRDGVIAAAYQAHYTADAWSAVLHLGLEDEAKGLRLEAVAANVPASSLGNTAAWSMNVDLSSAAPVVAGAPWLHPTTAPLSCAWLARLQTLTRSKHLRNISDVWSRDAGTYFCNEVRAAAYHSRIVADFVEFDFTLSIFFSLSRSAVLHVSVVLPKS